MTVPSLETLEQLTARTDWVRSLARRLVGDADLAEDVAQEAALAALRSSPPRAGGAWLSGVVRNLAANARRSRGRRARHEAAVAVREPVPSAADAVALVEQQRLLADAVLALDEPFRAVVLLRFYENRPRREIARELGIPVATVNSRLARAISKLRERLDRVHGGDRRGWVAALAPIALRGPEAGAVGLGAIAMKQKSILAALAVVLLSVGAWGVAAGWFGGAGHAAPALVQAPGDGASRSVPQPGPVPERRAADARAPVEVAAPSGPRVRVVDATSGELEPRAQVRHVTPEMRAGVGQVFDLFDLATRRGHRLEPGADGMWSLPGGDNVVLFAQHGDRIGHLMLRARERDAEVHELRLWPLQVARIVVRSAAGQLLAGVPIALRVVQPGLRMPISQVKTGADGVAGLRWYAALAEINRQTGRLEAALAFPGGEDTAVALEVNPQGRQDLELKCPTTGRVSVHVVQPSGPVADGTQVFLATADAQPMHRSVTTTVSGTAEFWPVAVGAALRASTWLKPGTQMFTVEGPGPEFEGHAVNLRIEMTARHVTLTGRVVDTDGNPRSSEEFLAHVEREGEQHPYLAAKTDGEGRFSLEIVAGAIAGGTLTLSEKTAARALASVGLPARGETGSIELGDVVVASAVVLLTGVVVDPEGRGIADTSVGFVAVSDRSSTGWESAGPRVWQTDADGRFECHQLPAEDDGELWLRADVRGAWRHDPQRWTPGTREVRLVVQPASVLKGQLAAGGVRLENLSVELWNEALGEPDLLSGRGWRGASVSARGDFAFGGLSSGTYSLYVFLPMRRAIDRVPGIVVRAGEVLDRRLQPLDLAGRVRSLDLRVTGQGGRVVLADVFAFVDRQVEHLGRSDRPALLSATAKVRTVIVEAEGYFAADLGPLESGTHEVVLRRGVAVAGHVSGLPALSGAYAARVALRAVEPPAFGPGGRAARSFRATWRPDHAQTAADGGVALRAPRPGLYRVEIAIVRDEDHTLDAIDVTPTPVPTVRVVEAGGRFAFAVDAATVAHALAELRTRRR